MVQPDQVANIGNTILQILLPVLATLGGLALNALRRWIETHTNIGKNSTIMGAQAILFDIVQTTVQSLEQTTVKALRDSNGVLDSAVGGKIKDEAISKISHLYGPDGIKDLSRRLGTSEDATLRYIGALVEQAVYLLKNPPAPATPAVPAFNPDVFGGMTAEERIAAQTQAGPPPQPT